MTLPLDHRYRDERPPEDASLFSVRYRSATISSLLRLAAQLFAAPEMVYTNSKAAKGVSS
jgi:hypothetical protein